MICCCERSRKLVNTLVRSLCEITVTAKSLDHRVTLTSCRKVEQAIVILQAALWDMVCKKGRNGGV